MIRGHDRAAIVRNEGAATDLGAKDLVVEAHLREAHPVHRGIAQRWRDLEGLFLRVFDQACRGELACIAPFAHDRFDFGHRADRRETLGVERVPYVRFERDEQFEQHQ